MLVRPFVVFGDNSSPPVESKEENDGNENNQPENRAAHRTSDRIDVYLFWNQPSSRVTVSVFDERTEERFELDVDSRNALDAFNHPFVYGSYSEVVPQHSESERQQESPGERR